jgi:UrcA family protein
MSTATRLILRSAALLTLCALASAGPVAGAEANVSSGRSAIVSLADLDLSTPEGARAARERLHQTARRLCSRVADSLDLSHHTNFVACVDESLSAALKKIQETPAASSNTPPQSKPIASIRHKPVLSTPYSRTSKISLADLDLTSPQGAEAARKRLDQTARRLCRQVADNYDLAPHSKYLACVDETLSKALRQVTPPVVAASTSSASGNRDRSDLPH